MTLAMDLQGIRDFVREHMDVDEEELSNALLDRFIHDGSSRIERATAALGGRWSFREVEYTFTCTANEQAYDLDAVATLIVPAPLAYIDDVRGPLHSLRAEDHRKMRELNRSSSTGTGTPQAFTVYGRHLYLWLTPSVSEDYTITGLRKQVDWIDGNESPDFPDEFHELIAWWALNRAYAQQDDLENASFYRDEFAANLRDRARPYVVGNDAAPFVLGGGRSRSVTNNPSGLGYSWEW